MRIVSDFDGVFTDPVEEAAAVADRQLQRLRELMGSDAEGILSALHEVVAGDPERHGWFSQGVLSCFADEDPYVFGNATAAALYHQGGAAAEALIAAGFPTHDTFSMACFSEGTESWRDAHDTHLLPEAIEALRDMVARGWEVTIVSNSSTDRVRDILGDLGFPEEKIALKGGARKFVITEEREGLPDATEWAGRRVRLDRGHYWDVLTELRPDAVIGDVFSLDLALPAHLARTEAWAEGLEVHLKVNTYTPDWAHAASEEAGVVAVPGLPEMVARLVGR